MKVIITGGAGFIASHVADAYIKAGHKVAIIDNLATGSRRNVNPKAKFYKADIRDARAMDRIFAKEKPMVVNHHAALVSVADSVENPLPVYETNIMGTANVLSAFGARGKGKHKKFIFASSGGAVYGDPKKIPADESTPIAPISPYGFSKHIGEELLAFYGAQYGFSHLIFRYTNVYGPRQNSKGEAGVVALFGKIMKRGLPAKIYGDGSKVRDYVYVLDVVRANLIALRKGVRVTMNIGCGKEITDQMIFKTVASAIGYGKKPIYAPFREGEIYRTTLDASLAKRLIGWKPTVSLEEGIRRTIRGTL